MELRWHDRRFSELSIDELYAIIALRERVFVVEQACPYLDADGYDPCARHLWAATEIGEIRAYLRIMPAGSKFAELSFGRVVTAPEARGTGLGRALIRCALAAVGPVPVRIGAQAHLERFYEEFGFQRAGADFVEDGIPHLEMLRP